MADIALFSALDSALASSGLRLDDLRRHAHAIALFGSRADGCASPVSDWDLLLIGPGRSRKLRGLDLVWIDARLLDTSAWLGGDLASHVAAHGLWLQGEPSWTLGDVDFVAAAHRKEERLARTLRALAEAWNLLGPAYRAKHATLVRRNAQRLRLLQCGLPIPPSARLDERWIADAPHSGLAEGLLGLAAPPELTRALVRVATPCAE